MAVEESNIPPDELFSSEPRGSAGEQSQDEENLGTVSETVYPDAPASAEDDADSPSHVVAVGASAGGLEALERFFRAMPEKSGMAFVVIQHLSPDFKSLMDELLERFNKMPAKQVTGDVTIKPNRIYLAPPGGELSIDGRTLSTRPRSKEGGLFLPIEQASPDAGLTTQEHQTMTDSQNTTDHEADAAAGGQVQALVRQGRAILKRLEWSAIYSYCTGWSSCPVCHGIKPGMGYDMDTDSYPANSGHRDDCALKQYIDASA
jgi:hypothetical protein